MTGEDDEETAQLQAMLQDARNYLLGFPWCQQVRQEFFGLGVGGVVGVFLFDIVAPPDVDTSLWVIIGDLPSAYLVTDHASIPRDALLVYCDVMEGWVHAVRTGGDLSEAFPVNAAPTEQNANLLEKRIAFLRQTIIPAFS